MATEQRPHAGWRIAGVMVLALSIRLGVFQANVQRPLPRFTVNDSVGYIHSATSLLKNGGFLDDFGTPAWSRPPAYPMVLALSFASGIASPAHLSGAVLINIVLSVVVVGITARIASQLTGMSAALGTGILMACEPSSIAYSNVILSETLFAFALLLTVTSAGSWLESERPIWLFAFALLGGLLCLVRAVALYLPILLAVLVWWRVRQRSPRLLVTLLFLLVAAAPAGAWSIRNFYYLGSAELDRKGPLAMAMFAHGLEDLVGIPGQPSTTIPAWEPGFGRDQGLPPIEAMRKQKAYFRQTLEAHPFMAVRYVSTMAVFLVGVPDSLLPTLLLDFVPPVEGGSVSERIHWLGQLGPLAAILLVGMVISVGGFVLMPLVLARTLARRDREKGGLVILIAGVLLYLLAVSSFGGGQGARYRVPMVPFLAVCFVCGTSELFARRKNEPSEADRRPR